MNRTRFAPSPTGPLHLGHAYAALIAQARGDEMLLRIEDIDPARARPCWEAGIHTDLAWLGIAYPNPVLRQSDRQPAYDAALDALWARGLLYPCGCSRADIKAALSAPQEGAPMIGPDGVIYPGTCRARPRDPAAPRPRETALRLDLAAAWAVLSAPLTWQETGLHPGPRRATGPEMITGIGDIVLARRDFGTSYHLSVVVDDAAQAITEVTRGADLAEATPIHVLLQRLLGCATPLYHHHALVRDETGKRLAKRDDARALRLYREAGWSAEALCAALLARPEALPLRQPRARS